MNTKRKSSRGKWAVIVLLSAALLLGGAAAACFVIPGVSRVQAGEGELILCAEENGKFLLTWPAPAGEAASRVSIRPEGGEEYQALDETTGNTAELDGSLLEAPFQLRVQAVVKGKNLLGMERELLSSNSIEASVTPPSVMYPELESAVDNPGELLLSWRSGGSYELCAVEGREYRILQEVSGESATLAFGGDGGLELPGYDAPLTLTLRAVRRGEGYVLYGPYAPPVTVAREDLLGSTLSLECQELDGRSYVLRWNETKGDYYEVREWSAAAHAWETLARVERTDALRYETGLLRSGSDHRYQIAVIGGDPEEPVEPVEVSFRAGISPLYATVWPVIDLTLYEDAAMQKSLTTVPAGTALCVLEEGADCFRVRYKDRYGCVDSRFCMINLPEYVGDFCAYSITNSYSSIFMVHDYPIESITGQVVQGFEGIRTAEDGFLVPYLYPCAKKLLTAAQAAERDGYRLRIYEAFRPNEATRFLYDTTLAQLDYPLPELDEEGNYVFYVPPEPDPGAEPDAGTLPGGGDDAPPPPEDEPAAPALPEDGEPDPDAPPETAGDAAPPEVPSDEPADPQLPESEGGLQEEPQPEPEDEFDGPTYRQIMTDGRFGISSFLAAVVSAHNRGIALDLTIEKLDGTPLEMQSAMHDLSWYSAAYLNNGNAKLLESYMTMPGVEMVGLTSEWWHFQDNDTREAIGLSAYLYKGVTAEGWKHDGTGWRYRYADGRYARSTTIRVDGQQYTMDAGGYVVE